MDTTHISVVLYGRDAHLLELRKWFLHSLGYRVFTAIQLSDLDLIPVQPPVALITLCHTVPAADYRATIAKATLRWPNIKFLSLARDGSAKSSAINFEAWRPIDAPTHLLTMVSELVGHAGSSAHLHTY
jgi:hypothetical protein